MSSHNIYFFTSLRNFNWAEILGHIQENVTIIELFTSDISKFGCNLFSLLFRFFFLSLRFYLIPEFSLKTTDRNIYVETFTQQRSEAFRYHVVSNISEFTQLQRVTVFFQSVHLCVTRSLRDMWVKHFLYCSWWCRVGCYSLRFIFCITDPSTSLRESCGGNIHDKGCVGKIISCHSEFRQGVGFHDSVHRQYNITALSPSLHIHVKQKETLEY